MIALPFIQECPGYSRVCRFVLGPGCASCLYNLLVLAYEGANRTAEQRERRRAASAMLRQMPPASASDQWETVQEYLGSQQGPLQEYLAARDLQPDRDGVVSA